MSFSKQVSVLFTVVLALVSLQAKANELGDISFVPLPGQPHDVVYDNTRGLAYVSNRSLNQIAVVNVSALSMETAINVTTGSGPRGMAISPDGNTLLVTLADGSQMGVFNLETRTQTNTINLVDISGNQGQRPNRVDFSADGTVFYSHNTPNNPYGKVHKLDLNTGISTRVLPQETWLRYQSSRTGSKVIFK
jgi:DNA-binding beta-propeller fold protein YncE